MLGCSCDRQSCCLSALVLLLLMTTAVTPSAALGSSGLSSPIWNHVLNTEPNRHLQQLGKISETEGALTRTYLSRAHKKAAHQIQQWMEDAGMTSYIDIMGNVHGIVEGTQPDLGELVVGSHYDTVVDGGKYDGALGVLLGISAVKAVLLEALIHAGRLSDIQMHLSNLEVNSDIQIPASAVKGLLKGSVHVIGFCDEEGIRFKSTFLGSRAMAGTLLKHNQLAAQDSQGQTLEEVLKASGVANPTVAIQALALNPDRVRHYVEFHIEQGPQLEAAGLALGVVSGIAGQTWLSVSIEGTQGHAGTVPMHLRKDPMAAAAEAIHAIEDTCTGNQQAVGGLDVADEALVCTVGRLHAHPNQVNIIPRWVNFTVDVRCKRQEFRQEVLAATEARIQAVCEKRGVACAITRTHDAAPVHSDDALVAKLQSAVLAAQPMIQQLVPDETVGNSQAAQHCDKQCANCGSASSSNDKQGSCTARRFTATQKEVPLLLSGAGHDAMAMADITKIAMVFVRCKEGISHNPAEHVDPRDVTAATAAFAAFMKMDLLAPQQSKDEL